ncbi:MAG: GNAT family N-acetyltransferase [Clostridia bacterium]
MTEIRRATEADVIGMARVYVQSWQKAYRGLMPDAYLDGLVEAEWAVSYVKRLGQPGNPQAGVLLEAGKIVGVSSFGAAHDLDLGEEWGEIISLYLLPECWERGLGTALLHWSLSELKKAGYTHCVLWTLQHNLRARKLYEREAFRRDGETKMLTIGEDEIREMRYVREI